MRKIVSLLVILALMVGGGPAFAKRGSGSGPHPNENAFEHANDNARFKRGDGWQPGASEKKHNAKKHHKKDKKNKNDKTDEAEDKDSVTDTVQNESTQ
jgi:hypothetical protein